MLGCVHHRLPRGPDDRGQVRSHRGVADTDQFHVDTVVGLDVEHLLRQGFHQAAGGRLLSVEPLPQLPLLAAGEGGHLLRVGRLALDQGQRLQDGVVQVGGHVGPCVGEQSSLAGLGQRPAHPQEPWQDGQDQSERGEAEDEQQPSGLAEDGRELGDQDPHGCGQARKADGDGHQGGPMGHQRGDQAAPTGPGTHLTGGSVVGLPPDETQPSGCQQARRQVRHRWAPAARLDQP